MTLLDQVPARKRVAALCITSLLTRCRTTLVSYVADEALRGTLPFPRYVPWVLWRESLLTVRHRMREEEVVYILRKLLDLSTWPGILWAALSDSPTTYSIDQPSMFSPFLQTVFSKLPTGIDPTLPPAQLIRDAIKRSSKAHLFHFYPVFCEIVAIPRKTPSTWVMTNAPRSSSRDSSGVAKPEELRNSVSWTDVNAGAVDEGRAVEMDARAIVKECLKEMGREMGVGM